MTEPTAQTLLDAADYAYENTMKAADGSTPTRTNIPSTNLSALVVPGLQRLQVPADAFSANILEDQNGNIIISFKGVDALGAIIGASYGAASLTAAKQLSNGVVPAADHRREALVGERGDAGLD